MLATVARRVITDNSLVPAPANQQRAHMQALAGGGGVVLEQVLQHGLFRGVELVRI
jgi:hypothetical protein